MLLSRHQNVKQNHNIKTADRSFENVAQFKYLRMAVINQNLIQKVIKRRLNLGAACYHSVQNLLICLLPKIYETILPVVFHGCEIWSLTLGEEHRLRCLRTGC
jgi:hypothetical protein